MNSEWASLIFIGFISIIDPIISINLCIVKQKIGKFGHFDQFWAVFFNFCYD